MSIVRRYYAWHDHGSAEYNRSKRRKEMSGETDLGALLASLTVTCDDEIYVFATLPYGQSYETGAVKMQFEEAEGTTLFIMTRDAAEASDLAYTFLSLFDIGSAFIARGNWVFSRDNAGAKAAQSLSTLWQAIIMTIYLYQRCRDAAKEVLMHMQQEAAANS